MPPIKFQLNPTYGLGGDVIWRISILDVGMEPISSSESPRLPNASHKVSAQSDKPFGSRCCFKIFKLATVATILDIRTEWL